MVTPESLAAELVALSLARSRVLARGASASAPDSGEASASAADSEGLAIAARLAVLAGAPGGVWDAAFGILEAHRLETTVVPLLKGENLLARLPRGLAAHLLSRHDQACRAQSALELATAMVANELGRVGVAPVACKGIVLARDYYPERGQRRMLDVDFWIAPAQLSVVEAAFARLGYREDSAEVRRGAVSFDFAPGVRFDVHLRFEHLAALGFTVDELAMPHPDAPYRVFVPEALLAHLAVHAIRHVREIGILLAWVVDLCLVIDRHGATLDWGRVERLVGPQGGTFPLFLRLLALARSLGWFTPPPAIAGRVATVHPLPLERILRWRRLRHWGLPRPVGFARWLVRGALGVGRGDESSPRLYPSDLLLWPVDWAREGPLAADPSASLFRERCSRPQ